MYFIQRRSPHIISALITRLWARWNARQVLHLWLDPINEGRRDNPITAPRVWIETDDESLRDRVKDFAADALGRIPRENEESGKHRRMIHHARRATFEAASISCSDRGDADVSALRAVHDTKAALSKYAALKGMKIKRAHIEVSANIQIGQIQALAKIHLMNLSIKLKTLEDLRSDEAWGDPWMTREMWRVLDLPDFNIVCDWYEQNKNVKVKHIAQSAKQEKRSE